MYVSDGQTDGQTERQYPAVMWPDKTVAHVVRA